MPSALLTFSTARLCDLPAPDPALPRYFQSSPAAWCALLVRAGAVSCYVDGRSCTANAGDLLLFPPASCHAAIPCGAGTQTATFRFTADAPAGSPDALLFSTQAHPAIQAIVQPLLHPALSAAAKDRLLEALLLELGTLSGAHILPPALPALARQILAYLNTHFREEISLSTLCAALHISSSHAIHVFGPVYRLSPIQYLIRRRIGEAQYLLAHTAHSAGDIAGLVGIYNRNYFYNTFKRLVRVPPSAYRSLFRAAPADRQGRVP